MLNKEWPLKNFILVSAAFQLIMCWFSFSWCKSPPDFLVSIKELNSNSVLFMSLEKNVPNIQMGEKNGIKARSLILLSFLPFNVQSNWYLKSISLLWVLESKRQCFRGGSILFYLELLFLYRKLPFCFFPLSQRTGSYTNRPVSCLLQFPNSSHQLSAFLLQDQLLNHTTWPWCWKCSLLQVSNIDGQVP